jgi:divalent metal cation (Fe/Co/Zn/Cd) transporter
MDGALGICVALLILYAAFDIVREGANPLMGAYPSVEFLNELYSLARRVTGTDLHIHHTHLHQYGDHREITFHILMTAVSTFPLHTKRLTGSRRPSERR